MAGIFFLTQDEKQDEQFAEDHVCHERTLTPLSLSGGNKFRLLGCAQIFSCSIIDLFVNMDEIPVIYVSRLIVSTGYWVICFLRTMYSHQGGTVTIHHHCSKHYRKTKCLKQQGESKSSYHCLKQLLGEQ